MAGDILIRPMRAGEEEQVLTLVAGVFHDFVAPGLEPGGIEEYLKHISMETMQKRQRMGNLTLLAEEAGEIIGVIDMRANRHISWLFVAAERQGQGLGKRLFEHAIAECRRNEPDLREVTVNSSLNAVEFYKHLGFEQIKEQQNLNGILYLPMGKRL